MMETYSNDAEMSALGAMLLSEVAAKDLEGMLESRFFYRPAHRLIFDAICDVLAIGGMLDFVLVKSSLIESGNLAAIGGEYYLLQLAEFCQSPSNSGYYAQTVIDKWFTRYVNETVDLSNKGEITQSEMRERLTEAMSVKDRSKAAKSGHVSEFVDMDDTAGVPCGFQLIDAGTSCQGLPIGQTTLIEAGTKGGKTALKGQMALSIARSKRRVVICTVADLDARGYTKRILRAMCGRGREPQPGTPEHERWCQSLNELRGLPIEIYDASENREGRYIETFLSWLEGLRYGPDVVFIDYAQKLRSRRMAKGSLLDHAEECSGLIKHAAGRIGFAAVVGSQLTDGNEKEGRKAISKGSRVWEEDAGLVLQLSLLDEKERKAAGAGYQDYEGLTLADLRYSRFGQSRQSCYWNFVGDYVSFRELA